MKKRSPQSSPHLASPNRENPLEAEYMTVQAASLLHPGKGPYMTALPQPIRTTGQFDVVAVGIGDFSPADARVSLAPDDFHAVPFRNSIALAHVLDFERNQIMPEVNAGRRSRHLWRPH